MKYVTEEIVIGQNRRKNKGCHSFVTALVS